MNCEQAREEMVSFVKGEMGRADERKLAEHLHACAACRSEEKSVRGLLEAIREFSEIEPSPGFSRKVMSAVRLESASGRRAARADRPIFWMFLGQRVRQAPFVAAAIAAHAAALIVFACMYLPGRFAPESSPAIGHEVEPFDAGGSESGADIKDVIPAVEGPAVEPQIPDFGNPPHIPFPGEESVLPGKKNPGRPAVPRWIDPRDFSESLKNGPRRAEVLGWFGERIDDSRKRDALGKAGVPGSSATIASALKWLASAQAADGSFEAGRDYPHFKTAVTGLALLAFLGDGSSTFDGVYGVQAGRAASWLLSQQDPATGLIGPRTGNYMYNHAIALTALCETYGMTLLRRPDSRQKSEQVIDAVRKGVEFLLKAQCPTGGWGYSIDDRASDTSVSAWPVAAISLSLRLRMLPGKQARHASDALDAAAGWFRYVTDLSGAVGYREPGKYKTGPHSLTAVSLYCRGLFLGNVTPEWRGLYEKQLNMVGSRQPSTSGKPDFYFWYYAANGLHHARAPKSHGFAAGLAATCSFLQQPDGSFRDASEYGAYGGKVYATAMAALALQTPYRYGR